MMKRRKSSDFRRKLFVGAVILLLVSCEDFSQRYCGASFCFSGSEITEFSKSARETDFSFYTMKHGEVDVGIYEGDNPFLPESNEEFSVGGTDWVKGCDDSTCSTWVSPDTVRSSPIVVVSVSKDDSTKFPIILEGFEQVTR